MNTPLLKALAAANIVAGTLISPMVHAATLEELDKKLTQQATEMQALRNELSALKAEQGKQATQVQQQSQVIEQTQQAGTIAQKTTISSYGEISYSRPPKNTRDTQVDVGRAVLGITHRFDEKTKMVAEFEWEHAVTSATDRGEAEVEQLYVEHELGNGVKAKGGLFLIPAGFLNTSHEPTTYYGVRRNFVETAIIPTTWREVGIGLSGTTANSLSWDVGLTTGFDITKWDSNSQDGRDSPLRSTHQEGQLAKARNLSMYAALNWQAVPGLLLGGSMFSGKAGHNTATSLLQSSSVTLFDLHGRYQTGKWDLSALYARGAINNTDAFNASVAGNPTPVPRNFYGAYVQAAYKLWKSQSYSLTPFARYERVNTAKSYSDSALAGGATVNPDERISTLGANLLIGEGVVLKMDYQKFKQDPTRDRLNLGMGYSF